MALSDSLFDISPLEGEVTWVKLLGDIDLTVEDPLRESLDQLIREGHRRLLVDLAGVSFIDSAGLAIMLHIAGQLRDSGGLAVACPDPSMRGVFELVGLNLLFPVDETVDQALRHLKPHRRFAPRSRAPKPQSSH